MSEGFLTATLSLGFVLGLRHALDPDHIVAVSTIVSQHRSLARSSLVGTIWGLGHTTSLLVVGIGVLALRLRLSGRVALWMELAVAVMLVALGIRAVRGVFRGWTLHLHRHIHEGHEHMHLHLHEPGEIRHTPQVHDHRHVLGVGVQPFLVGMVHGLAGSAGLMLLVLGTIRSVAAGLTYIVVFGLGSVGGMLMMSSLIGVPFVLTARRFERARRGLQLAAGLSSIALGLFLFWQHGFHEHLLIR